MSVHKGDQNMKGTTNVVKGRIEEAAGALVGNDKLRAKGRSDQILGHAEQAAESGVKRARKTADAIVDKAKEVAQGVVDRAKGRNA